MLLLGVDFETTGLDVEKDLIIEVGAVLWDTTREVPIKFISGFVKHPGLTEIKPEITELTGIDFDLIDDHVKDCFQSALEDFCGMTSEAHYLVAHNARGFDKPMLESHMKRHVENGFIGFPDYSKFKWIDTRTDVPYPKSITTRNLKYLLAEHGIINPFSHRALTDALCMMTLLAKYDINEVIKISQTPNLKVRAMVSYDDRQKAKDRSYHWDQKSSAWFKLIKKTSLEEEEKLCSFQIKVIEEIAP